jgi:hypothetical protein
LKFQADIVPHTALSLGSWDRMNLSMSDTSAGHLLTDKTLLKFCNYQIVTSITLTSYERLDIKYAWMTSPVYWELTNLIVSFTSEIQVCLGMFWCRYNWIRLTWQSLLLKHLYRYCVHISLLNISLKISSNFSVKSPKIIYILYLWKSMNSYSNPSYKLCLEVSTFILSWRTQILYITPATFSSIYYILSLTNSAHFYC